MPAAKLGSKPKSQIRHWSGIILQIRKKRLSSEKRLPIFSLFPFLVGLWRSLVARLSGGQEVPSSNLGSPTIFHLRCDSRMEGNSNHSFGMITNSIFSVRKLWPVITLVLSLAWASSYQQGGPEGPDIPYFDKIAHFFVFGLMGMLCYRCIPRMPWSRTRWLAALAFVLAYGMIDEWIQSHNPNRSSDALDWVADASGAFTAIAVYRFWALYRRVLESRFGDLVRGRLTELD